MEGKEALKPKYTPEQETDFRKTRTKEIANLIQGGAIFLDDGRLEVTSSQIESIKREKQREEAQNRFNRLKEDLHCTEGISLPLRREVLKDLAGLERIKSATYEQGLRKQAEINSLHETLATVIPRLRDDEEYRREFKHIEAAANENRDVLTTMGQVARDNTPFQQRVNDNNYVRGLNLLREQIRER
jgi:hypothetical protein